MLKIPEEEKAILVDMEDGTQRIIQDDIVYIEAFAHYIDIYTMNQKFSARKSIGAIEKELDKDMFIRCHRSYIVGLKYIKRMESSELELDNGNVIPISRRQYSNTNMAFIRYFRGDTDE
jgi:DNA-binding LytR/AlgR family response regulator